MTAVLWVAGLAVGAALVGWALGYALCVLAGYLYADYVAGTGLRQTK